MSNKVNKDETGLMESLTGIRRLEHDKVDLYHNSPRKKHRSGPHRDFIESTSEFASISHNTPVATEESWFHHGIQKKLRHKIKRGQLNIDAMIDLHGHRKHEANLELESFIKYAIDTNARLLLIIHGKGFNSQTEAVLRPMVQHWLSEQKMILAYCPAQPKDGGSGASYVYLKSNQG